MRKFYFFLSGNFRFGINRIGGIVKFGIIDKSALVNKVVEQGNARNIESPVLFKERYKFLCSVPRCEHSHITGYSLVFSVVTVGEPALEVVSPDERKCRKNEEGEEKENSFFHYGTSCKHSQNNEKQICKRSVFYCAYQLGKTISGMNVYL